MRAHPYYPVFLDLADRLAVVVGGGPVAAEKVEGLLAVGARVRVVAPAAGPRIRALAAQGAVELRERGYRAGDLDAAMIAIVAEATAADVVGSDAAAARVPLNVVDAPERCDWIAGAVLRRGLLAVAISTSGAAPAVAVRLKERLAGELGPEYARFLDLAAELRPAVTASGLSFEARRALWYRIVDSDALDALRAGDERRARAILAALFEEASPGARATA